MGENGSKGGRTKSKTNTHTHTYQRSNNETADKSDQYNGQILVAHGTVTRTQNTAQNRAPAPALYSPSRTTSAAAPQRMSNRMDANLLVDGVFCFGGRCTRAENRAISGEASRSFASASTAARATLADGGGSFFGGLMVLFGFICVRDGRKKTACNIFVQMKTKQT